MGGGIDSYDVAYLVVDEVSDSSLLPILGAAVDVVGSGNDLIREKKMIFEANHSINKNNFYLSYYI